MERCLLAITSWGTSRTPPDGSNNSIVLGLCVTSPDSPPKTAYTIVYNRRTLFIVIVWNYYWYIVCVDSKGKARETGAL